MTTGVIVFGGSGFIGTHLLRTLSADPDNRLTSVDRRPPKTRIPGVNYIHADVRDLSALAVDGTVDTIYNFAAVHTTPGHPDPEYYENNVAGATEITAFARRNGIRDIVFTSSVSVYGAGEETKYETTPPAPDSAYGWSKLLAEGIHRAWMEEDASRKLVIVRPSVTFGTGEGGNFTRLAKLMRKGVFVYPGRKDTIKGCFYVDDLLQAIAFARSRNERSILFNGCYPDRYTLQQIVEAFQAAHFPNVRTFLLPRVAVTTLAKLLRPFSALGLGIHPERVMKLVRSTDIVPGWLQSRGFSDKGRLPSALQRWSQASDGRFD